MLQDLLLLPIGLKCVIFIGGMYKQNEHMLLYYQPLDDSSALRSTVQWAYTSIMVTGLEHL